MSTAAQTRARRAARVAAAMCPDCGSQPATPTALYCASHRRYRSLNQNQKRRYRVQLGFCTHCLERQVPGLTVCEKHQRESVAASAAYREKRKARRGWKLVRVAV